jgi:hypothetical protein
LSGGGEYPDTYSMLLPFRPFDALSFGEAVGLGILHVDPTLAPLPVIAIKIGDADLKRISNHAFH